MHVLHIRFLSIHQYLNFHYFYFSIFLLNETFSSVKQFLAAIVPLRKNISVTEKWTIGIVQFSALENWTIPIVHFSVSEIFFPQWHNCCQKLFHLGKSFVK